MRKEEEKQSEFKKGSVDFCVVVVVAFSCFFFFCSFVPFYLGTTKSHFFLRLIHREVHRRGGAPPHIYFVFVCGAERKDIFLLLLLQQQHQEQQHFLHSYANKSASRQNNFVLKHATDARRRKFSNDDDVERARE